MTVASPSADCGACWSSMRFMIGERQDESVATPGRPTLPAIRVEGPDISGQAEYQAKNGGRLLVAYVDFSVGDSRMRVIQNITHHEDRGTLLARYMDTMATRPRTRG